MTDEWVAPEADDPALDALADGLAPARALGLATEPAEAILRGAKGRLNGTRAQASEEARIALTDLARAAGLKPQGVRELIPDPARRRAVDGAIAEIAFLMDMDGFEQKAVAVVRARARVRGLGPLRWTPLLRQGERREAGGTTGDTNASVGGGAQADAATSPEAHLLAWQSRGELEPAGDHVRRVIDDTLPSIPEGLRARYAAAGRGDLEARLHAGIERVVIESAPEAGVPPTNQAWRFVGLLQWLNFVILLVAIVGLAGGMTGLVPAWRSRIEGLSEAPLVLCPLLAFVLTTWLHINVAKLGRAWSSRIENEIRRGIRVVVEAEAFAPLAPIESARARLGEAWHRILA